MRALNIFAVWSQMRPKGAPQQGVEQGVSRGGRLRTPHGHTRDTGAMYYGTADCSVFALYWFELSYTGHEGVSRESRGGHEAVSKGVTRGSRGGQQGAQLLTGPRASGTTW
eukprot:930149-Prorocentrum_minimum.AAC.1